MKYTKIIIFLLFLVFTGFSQSYAIDVKLAWNASAEADYYIVFNEGQSDLEVELKTSVKGKRSLLDPRTSRQQVLAPEAPLLLRPHELRVIMVTTE